MMLDESRVRVSEKTALVRDVGRVRVERLLNVCD